MFQLNSFLQCIKVTSLVSQEEDGGKSFRQFASSVFLTIFLTCVFHHLFIFYGRIKPIWSLFHSTSCPNMIGSLHYQPQNLCMLVFQHQAFKIEGTIGPLSELG